MTIGGPDFVSFQVRDLDASARFYTDVVGMTRIPVPNPHAVAFSDGRTTFAVRTPVEGADLDAGGLGRGIGVWFRDPDAAGLHARMVEAGVPIGVPITTEPVDGPFGFTFAFTDPDGYTVTVHERA